MPIQKVFSFQILIKIKENSVDLFSLLICYIHRYMVKKPTIFAPDTSSGPQEALGQSEAFLAFQERLSQVARVNRPVLLIGERGTGKELAAARLHYLSEQWQGSFVTLHCAALSPGLIEAELFGHEAGAFTGATRQRLGRFESAHNGTLFLDEIGNIPLETQEKVLRVVEYGSFERVGSSQPIETHVRIIGATNADLKALAARGQFRADLLDRLSFEVLFLPPLRERPEDIVLLTNRFAARMAFELGREDVPQFSDAARAVLDHYPWPGNVRELKNVVERAVYRADTSLIHEADIVLDPFQTPFQPAPQASGEREEEPAVFPRTVSTNESASSMPFTQAVQEFECRLLANGLRATRYNQKQAAERLGLTYHQFRGLYRKYEERLQRQEDE